MVVMINIYLIASQLIYLAIEGGRYNNYRQSWHVSVTCTAIRLFEARNPLNGTYP